MFDQPAECPRGCNWAVPLSNDFKTSRYYSWNALVENTLPPFRVGRCLRNLSQEIVQLYLIRIHLASPSCRDLGVVGGCQAWPLYQMAPTNGAVNDLRLACKECRVSNWPSQS